MTAPTFVHVSSAAFAEAWSNRAAFWSKVAVMAFNDAIWALFFFIIFKNAGTIRGWDFSDMMVLSAVITTAFGFAMGFCANSRKIGLLVSDGGLDSVLTLPASPLGVLLFRKVEPVAIGDGVYGLVIFLLLANPTPGRLAIYLVTSLFGAVILVAFVICVASLAFWAQNRTDHTDLVFNALVLFGTYPADFFSGATKVLLYTVIPTAFISTVPARLVNDFQWQWFVGLVVIALAFAVLARTIFNLGLTRYRSGAMWSRG